MPASASYVYKAQWGSEGSGDGQFDSPDGIAIDFAGNVYVSERDNDRIQKFSEVPDPGKARISKVTVSGRAKVKKGRKATY